MPWHAKPSGAYVLSSQESQDNILMINGFLNSENYTLEAQAGIIGNIYAESGLNPWRWQSDIYNPSGGYGFFQYTPGTGYLNLSDRGISGFSPSHSTTSIDPTATLNDAWAQLVVMNDNILGKWVGTCWRSYWSSSSYPQLYQDRAYILNTWGNGSRLTQEQFKTISDIYYATFAFLSCFEGPSYPNQATRKNYADYAYQIITGTTPPDPPTPGPIPPGPTPSYNEERNMPFYLYFL